MDKWSICRECGGEMQKYDDGEYIKYDDYERLTARVKELELMNSELGKWYSELKSAFEQQIQQAERRGWDLKDKYMHLKIWNDAHRCMVNYTYEQACAERDGGAV